MKLYISADIEGVAGINAREETINDYPDYIPFKEQMTKEVLAACEGALRAGAKEIWIKDGHGTGRNIDVKDLPKEAKIIRGWSGHPFTMMQELDKTFDGVLYIGYHSPGGKNGNPLAHTINSAKVESMILNGELLSEFKLSSYMAAYYKVPILFLSGDAEIAEEAEKLVKSIKTVATFEGIGMSSVSISPRLAVELIEKGVAERIQQGSLGDGLIQLPDQFEFIVNYHHHSDAYTASFYPGVEQISPKSVRFISSDYFEVARCRSFIV